MQRGDVLAQMQPLVVNTPLEAIWHEYVQEAEHADGMEYWEQFATLEAVQEDLTFYASFYEDPQ